MENIWRKLSAAFKKDLAVVIPVYKLSLSEFEKESLIQCINVLGNKYDIYLHCPQNLDVSEYQKYGDNKLKINSYDNNSFTGTVAYSNMLRSTDFYNMYSKYKYILIYQLDAYIFEDKLDYFIKLGYDYYGSPWAPFGDKVGNGGFSLRKVDSMINAIGKNKPFEDSNEDIWFCLDNEENLNICPLDIAVEFSLETEPQKYIDEFRKMPMGVHRPFEYDNEFWKQYIKCLQ